MLSAAENDLLCRVGPGTPMGDLMREYWLPALRSAELPAPNCAPVRVRLLGENLIAFRATSGRIGLLPNSCPHRGASMFFGRNEEEGLRCVYHGWKFDTTGQCVDMPSEPPESVFKTKVRAHAYPCVERSGIVWSYMGPRETPPPLPDIEPNMLAEGEWAVQTVFRDCNWMQGLEGDIDTSHLGFLHLGALGLEDTDPGSFDRYSVVDRAPRYTVLETDFGTSYGAYRPAEADSYYWRVAHFLFPFFTMIPTGLLGVQVLVRAWVPIDDEHMMFWSIAAPRSRSVGQGGVPGSAASLTQRSAANSSAGTTIEFEPDTTDWYGRSRIAQNSANDYRIDRAAQAAGASYTGIFGIHQQDQAMTESMGPIYDRSQEHLGSSDAMVIQTRRRLINAAKALREHGTPPPAVDSPELYRQRSGGVILPRNVDWIEATKELRKAFVRHRSEDVYAPKVTA